jgi:hypothetical protein
MAGSPFIGADVFEGKLAEEGKGVEPDQAL